jgi:hypothetical protein
MGENNPDYYFNLGQRFISSDTFDNAFFDLIYNENYDHNNVIDMFIGTIYYGNYISCERLINNYNFNQYIYNNSFIQLTRQYLDELYTLINNGQGDEEALLTYNFVLESIPFIEYNYNDNSDIEEDTEDENGDNF